MKQPYQLKTIYDFNNNVLCQGHYDSWADMVQENKKYLKGANLRDKDLRGTDLRGANLQDADLRGANLAGATLWGIGKDGDFRAYGVVAYVKEGHRILAVSHPYDVMWWCDNFWGGSKEFIAFFANKSKDVTHLVNRTKCDWDYED